MKRRGERKQREIIVPPEIQALVDHEAAYGLAALQAAKNQLTGLEMPLDELIEVGRIQAEIVLERVREGHENGWPLKDQFLGIRVYKALQHLVDGLVDRWLR